jgi:uncharacterized membrane protein YgdD (TMEM256/DUF423 family)
MRWILVTAALLGATSVIIAAAARHMGGDNDIIQTALHYHQLHNIVLLALGLYALSHPGKAVGISALLFIAGVLIFSGSLYALALTGIAALGYATPVGGTLLIGAWLSLAAIRRID